jgi:hypothetical protein
LGAKWKAASAADKLPYVGMATKDKERYDLAVVAIGARKAGDSSNVGTPPGTPKRQRRQESHIDTEVEKITRGMGALSSPSKDPDVDNLTQHMSNLSSPRRREHPTMQAPARQCDGNILKCDINQQAVSQGHIVDSSGTFVPPAGKPVVAKKRKRIKAKDNPATRWRTEYLDPITWRNLRLTIPGFIGYATQILLNSTTASHHNTQSRMPFYVPVLHSNTSYIEAGFSLARLNNHTTAQTYATGQGTLTHRKAGVVAARNSNSYLHEESYDAWDSSLVTTSGAKQKAKQLENDQMALVSMLQRTCQQQQPTESSTTRKDDNLGIVWLLDCVVSLQEKWVMTFLWQRAKMHQSLLPKAVVDEHSEVQRFVGFAIQGCLKKWRDRTRGSAMKADADGEEIERSMTIVVMLESMRILRDNAVLDEEYVSKYYTKRDEIINEGGWCLVSKTMFPWAILLMKAIRKYFDRSQLEGEGKVAVQRALKLVKKERAVSQSFRACVKNLEVDKSNIVSLSDSDLEELHDKLLKKAFHARIEVVFKDFKEHALNNQTGATKIDLRTKLLAANELSQGKSKLSGKDILPLGKGRESDVDLSDFGTQEEHIGNYYGDDEFCGGI